MSFGEKDPGGVDERPDRKKRDEVSSRSLKRKAGSQ